MAVARGIWQRCMRDVTGPFRRTAAAEALQASRSAISVLGDKFSGFKVPVSEVPLSRPSFSWGLAGVTRDSFFSWTVSSGRCFKSAAAPKRLISGERFSLGRFLESNAMKPFSTVPETDQNASEYVPSENLSPPEEVVDGAAEPSLEPELAPEIESVSPSILNPNAPREDELRVSPEGSSKAQVGEIGVSEVEALADSEREVHPGRVYVGGLPYAMKGDDLRDQLRELCGKYGTVTDVSLAQHRNQSAKSIAAGKHRGFAFVMMETPEQAEAVIENLNGATTWGRDLIVSYGLKNIEPQPRSERVISTEKAAVRGKVFVGNLDEGTTAKDLLVRFQEFGKVVDVKLVKELHSNRSRGFGFVTFADEGQAIRCVLDLDGSILDGSVIKANIAKYPQGY